MFFETRLRSVTTPVNVSGDEPRFDFYSLALHIKWYAGQPAVCMFETKVERWRFGVYNLKGGQKLTDSTSGRSHPAF